MARWESNSAPFFLAACQLYLGPCFEKTSIGRSLWHAIGNVKLFPNCSPIVPLYVDKSVDKISYSFWHLAGTQFFQGHVSRSTFQGVYFNQDVIMRHWQLIDCPSV